MNKPEGQVYTITAGAEDKRLDVFLSRQCDLTRSAVIRHIAEGRVRVNGAPAEKSGQKLRAGDAVVLIVPPPEERLTKADIPINILYEDEDIAVIIKPQGLTVHPAGTNRDQTLVNALLFHLKSLSGVGGVIRPGIVHRLDKDTSGVMMIAKNDAAHLALSGQLKDRTVKKEYRALVEGKLKQLRGRIDAPIGRDPKNGKRMAVRFDGKPATTTFTAVTVFDAHTYAAFDILTGRTHQIRVHAAAHGHPVIGDPLYGYKKQRFTLSGQMLHAYKLTFTHPASGKEMSFTAPLPDEFIRVYNVLALESGQDKYDESLEASVRFD